MKETFGVVKLSLLLLADIFTKFAHFELFERQSDTERDREGGGWGDGRQQVDSHAILEVESTGGRRRGDMFN